MKRFALAALGCSALMIGGTTPATAQVDDAIVLNILRECAKIDDAQARLACYDNNIRAAGGKPRSNTVPNASASGASASTGNDTFGAEDIRKPERFAPAPENRDELSARVASVRERQPGTYLITLESGAQWLFTESVSSSYRPPRRGSTVEIKAASLGSYLMVADGQAGVRVKRVK
ncbi:hypothetical protein [Altericroceibacterium endophyticum]|uniref:Type IV pilus biogenesis protein PilP n=1 Tax=Altericroceibacterium endophyticum TaxID=1808508 RepID=A0A6I4T2F7_9SPHN|nr:hypothetical protein [Altericroceibacterium endophyticum]MXO64411.1 hypothetical protein [Altericroceibacterium endophyticum]